jgi:hypothetical protein
MKVQNPAESGEYMLTRNPHGMRLHSGSGTTTFCNSLKAEGIGLSHAFYGGEFEDCATMVGSEVTTKKGPVSNVTFLSKFFYESEGKICAALDIASITRKLGLITGDALGKKSILVSDRIIDATREVISGHIHEPDSLLLTVLRQKYSRNFLERVAFRARVALGVSASQTCYDVSYFTDVDWGIIKHYYGPGERDIGVSDYLRCIHQTCKAPDYGSVIFSQFIDRVMKVRYGMAPCCK